MENFVLQILLFVPPFLLAISFHESAHAYVADKLGDATAKNLGRITLNPIPHIDFFGLLALFLVHFGWAKPVPINPYNLRNPIKDNLWISVAGPASNLALAILSAIAYRLASSFLGYTPGTAFLLAMIKFSVALNLVLMVFNLFPIPPLDGFHVLEGLVSPQTYIKLQSLQLQQVGPLILFGLILLSGLLGINFFAIIFTPIVRILGGFLIGEPIGW